MSGLIKAVISMVVINGDSAPLWAERALRSVMVLKQALLVMGLSALMACAAADGGMATEAPEIASPTTMADAGEATASAAQDDAATTEIRTVLVMGDSLSAAYNLSAEQGWVALLDARLPKEAPGYRMINASISGETTAGGVSRIDAALAQHQPLVVVIELGANDGLRGLPLEETRANLERMVRAAKAVDAKVLLIGMRLPPNYGPEYTGAFHALFGDIAGAEGVAHLPFLLEPIAMDEAFFQADRLHPTAEAQPKIAEHVWPALEPLLVP